MMLGAPSRAYGTRVSKHYGQYDNMFGLIQHGRVPSSRQSGHYLVMRSFYAATMVTQKGFCCEATRGNGED